MGVRWDAVVQDNGFWSNTGRAFLDRVTAPGGGILRFCRVFVNGQSVDDATAPIQTTESPTQVEMILLTAAEGG